MVSTSYADLNENETKTCLLFDELNFIPKIGIEMKNVTRVTPFSIALFGGSPFFIANAVDNMDVKENQFWLQDNKFMFQVVGELVIFNISTFTLFYCTMLCFYRMFLMCYDCVIFFKMLY